MGAARLRLLLIPFLLSPCLAQSPLNHSEPAAPRTRLVGQYGNADGL